MKTNLLHFFLITLFLSINLSCSSEEDVLDCIPNSSINISLDMSLSAYQNLQSGGGWIYYNGALSGSKGLILVNTGSEIKAYDRNAPHICPGDNTRLKVESDVKIVCEQDNAEWILTTGQPLEIATVRPITYATSVNGNIVSVSN